MSIEDMLKKGGAPKDIIDLYTYTNATESTTVPSKMSALYMVLTNARASAFSEDTVEGRILGGNDKLPKTFAKKLGSKIKYNRALKRLKFNDKGVTAIVNKNGVKGLKLENYPSSFGSLLNNQASTIQLTTDAIINKSKHSVYLALLADPIVDNAKSAERLIETMISFQKDYLGYLN